MHKARERSSITLNSNTTQGLSQGSVIDIFQDNIGYLWFGTREGLNKFDGTSFTTFRHISEDSTSISDS